MSRRVALHRRAVRLEWVIVSWNVVQALWRSLPLAPNASVTPRREHPPLDRGPDGADSGPVLKRPVSAIKPLLLSTAVGLAMSPVTALASEQPEAGETAAQLHDWGPVVSLVEHKRVPDIGPVTVDRSGVTVATWTEETATTERVWSAVRDLDAAEWSRPLVVSPPNMRVWTHAIVPYRSGAMVFWQGSEDGAGGFSIWSRQVDADGSRGPIQRVVSVADNAVRLLVDSGPNASLAVATLDEERRPLVLRRVPGGTWQALPTPGSELTLHGLAVDEDRVTILGLETGGDDPTLHLATWQDEAWSLDQIGPADGYDLETPNVTVALHSGPKGEVAAIWKEWLEAGPEVPNRLMVAYRGAGAEKVESTHELTATAACRWADLCGSLALGRRGALLAAWQETTGQANEPELVMSRRRTDGSWSTREVLLTSRYQTSPLVVGHDSGNSLIVTQAEADGEWRLNVFSCPPRGSCEPPAALSKPPTRNGLGVAAGPRGSATLLGGSRCKGEECYWSPDVLARTRPPR